jgi:hypothetical protein
MPVRPSDPEEEYFARLEAERRRKAQRSAKHNCRRKDGSSSVLSTL